MHPQPSGLEQAPRAIDPREQRLAAWLLHALKAGVSSADRRSQLLGAQVAPDHPQAVLAFRGGIHEPADVYVDLRRLPCDHGRRA
jgi:hypothetical protein